MGDLNELGNLDLSDLELEDIFSDGDMEELISNAETLELNPYRSEDSLNQAKYLINYSLDRMIRIKSLNLTLANAYSTREFSAMERSRKLLSDYEAEKSQKTGSSNSIMTNMALKQVDELLTDISTEVALLQQSRMSARLPEIRTRLNSLTRGSLDSRYLTKKLTDFLIRLSNLLDSGGIDIQASNYILSVIYWELHYIKGSLVEVNHTNKPHIIESSGKAPNVENIDEFLTENLNVDEQINILLKIKKDINKIETSESEEVPNIYKIDKFILYKETDGTEFLDVQGSLLLSNYSTTPYNSTYSSLESTFLSYINIMTMTGRQIEFSNGGTSKKSRKTLHDVYTATYLEMVEHLGIEPVPEIVNGMLDYNPVFYDKISNNLYIIDPESEEMSPRLVLNSTPLKGSEETYQTFLQRIKEAREIIREESSSNAINYITAVSIRDSNLNLVAEEELNKSEALTKWGNRYTNEELGKMVTQRNMRKLLGSNLLLELDTSNNTQNLGITKSDSQKAKEDWLLKAGDALDSLGIPLREKFKPNDIITFSTGNIITEFAGIFMDSNIMIDNILELDKEYQDRKVQLHRAYANGMISKAEHEVVAIKDILGELSERKIYHEIIMNNGETTPEFNMKKKLRTDEITDTLWVMVKLYTEGLDCTQLIHMDVDEINVNGNKLNHKEFVKFVYDSLSKPTCLEDLWGYRLEAENITLSGYGEGRKRYLIIRKVLSQAMGVYSILKENMEEVNSYMYDITNLNTEETEILTEDEMKDIEKYGLTEEFYNSYNKYLNRQINAIIKGKKMELPTVVDVNEISKAFLEYRWNTKNPDKEFAHQLVDLTRNPKRTTSQIMKQTKDSWDILPELIELRNNVDEDAEDTIKDFLKIVNKEVSKPNKDLDKLIMQMIYMTNDSSVYIYDLYEYIVLTFKDNSLDDFTKENAIEFSKRIGLDGCTTIPTTEDITNSLESNSDKTFALRDEFLLNTVLNRGFLRVLKYSEPENLKDNILEHMEKQLSKSDIQTSLGRLTQKMTAEDILFLNKSVEVLKEVVPHELDMVYNLNQLSRELSNTEKVLDSKVRYDNKVIRKGVDIVKVETEINKLQDELNGALVRYQQLYILSKYVPFTLVEQVREDVENLTKQIEELMEENFDSLSEVKIDINTQKKSIALYRQYLLKGEPRYLEEVDMDSLPFELLTKDRTMEEKTDAHFSKVYLDTIYDLDLRVNTNSYAIKEEFEEIFNSIMEKESNFFENSPLAIKQHIIDNERHNRNLVASNFR